MNEMQFVIDIKAPKDVVWNTLWQDETFRDWASVIDPETYMVGDLVEMKCSLSLPMVDMVLLVWLKS